MPPKGHPSNVFKNACCMISKLNVPYIKVMTTVPIAPMAAASVGVANPSMIVPSTAKISINGGTSAVAVIHNLLRNGGSFSAGGSDGPSCGLIIHRPRI